MSELNDIFKHNCGVRFLNKSVNCNERANYKNWWLEQLYQYGTIVDYYVNGTTLENQDALYGENTVQKFAEPKKLIFGLTLNENSVILQKFGLVSDDELTGFIAIESFNLAFSGAEYSEPKSGDVIELTEFGSTRPGGRGAKKFEITDRLDQDVEQINPLLGHYVWLIKAKRYDYSFEEGITPEPAMNAPTDDSYSGLVNDSGNPIVEDNSLYFNDVDRASRNIFDYSVYGDYDDIYGGYDD